MERALNASEDDGFGAIVQNMRDAPTDPTVPRPQRKPVAQDKGFNFGWSHCESHHILSYYSCFKPSKHVCYGSRLHVLMMIFALTAPCEFLMVSGCRC